ncbi:Peroxisomal sarcosine oxidase [Trichinella pseudospiralis]
MWSTSSFAEAASRTKAEQHFQGSDSQSEHLRNARTQIAALKFYQRCYSRFADLELEYNGNVENGEQTVYIILVFKENLELQIS